MRRRNRRRGWLVAVVMLAAAGCMTVGRDFSAVPVAELQTGETTDTEVRRLFGPPWRTGVENGQRTWTYGYYRYRLFADTETKDLVVRFDDDGVVQSYSFNETTPE